MEAGDGGIRVDATSVIHFPTGDFNKEDLAAALLETATCDIAQCLHQLYQRQKFNRVFWCGSFVQAEVVRKYLTGEWWRRAMNAAMMTGEVSGRRE